MKRRPRPPRPPISRSAASKGRARTPPQRARLAWSDFNTVLAVARRGSVARASADLALTHVTLLRRLASIEQRLNVRLFDRVRGRYSLTAGGEEIARAAESFEPVALATEMRVLGRDLRPSGPVRVAVAGVVIDWLLPPILRQFASAFPDVTIELIAARDHVSLTRHEADVAIRISDRVPEWLVGRRLAELQFKIYTLKRPGLRVSQRKPEDLFGEPRWIGFEQDARDLKFDRWLDAKVPDASVRMRVDSFSHALSMVRAGLGIALLPAFLERSCPDLQPVTKGIAELQTPLWIVTHEELRNAARVKVFTQAFGPALAHAVR